MAKPQTPAPNYTAAGIGWFLMAILAVIGNKCSADFASGIKYIRRSP